MCGWWLIFMPFVMMFAYAYWWANFRQKYPTTHEGSLLGNLIFFGTVLGVVAYLYFFCAPELGS
jgi:hypothetical protein